MEGRYNRYDKGLRPNHDTERYRSEQGIKITFRKGEVAYFYQEELKLIWALWCYAKRCHKFCEARMPHIELEENNTPQNEWDNTQSIHSGDFLTGNLRCAIDRAIIAKIVYRSIWGVRHCPHSYSVFVHLLLTYSERCTMTADEGPHWTYFPGCGEVFQDPCLWADEARDAYAAWYKTGGRIKDCENHAVLDVYHYKKGSEGGREISSIYPYFHPRPTCEEVLSENGELVTKKYRKAVHCEKCRDPYGLEKHGFISRILGK
ncbi:MAG: hypothetical protein Q9164_004304 [Protoblastenia rupestris]